MKMISNKIEYEAIMERVDELVEIVDDNTPLTDKNCIELDFLVELIVSYEKEHYPIGKFLPSEAFVSPSFQEQEIFS